MIARTLTALLYWLALASPLAAPLPLTPALWVARDGSATAWLFGTVHQLRPATPWLTGRIAQAFATSDTLLLELVAPSPSETTAALAAVTDRQSLPADLRRRRDARAAALGFPAGAFDRHGAWFAATALGGAALARDGYTSAPAPETLLARLAARDGKSVIGLETQRAQLEVFAALPPPVQRRMLAQALSGDGVGAMDRLVASWGSGNVAALRTRFDAGIATAGPAFRSTLLDRRNAAFTIAIRRHMAPSRTLFVALGAGHMLGPGGVPARLAAQGMTVRRVQ